MSSALDKVLLAAQGTAPAAGDPGTDLVAATIALLDHALVQLAWDPDNDGDDDSSAKGDTDKDYAGKKSKCPAGVKGCDGGKSCHHTAPKGKGDDDSGKPSFPPKKKVKATALAAVAAARLALSGLSTEDATADWVQATSVSAALALSQAPAGRPETYADPGFLSDGRARYPLDAERIHISLAQFAAPANRGGYTKAQADRIWDSIRAAASRHGVGLDTLVALAAPGGEAVSAMHHGPFTGKHSHAHHTTTVATTAHYHNADNRHGDRSGYGDY